MTAPLEIIAVVEGQTEQEFIWRVIAPHLQMKNLAIRPVLSGKPSETQHGGVKPWLVAQNDITRYLKDGKYVTTLFDFYGLHLDWPGRTDAANLPWSRKGNCVEAAVLTAVQEYMGASFNPARFQPCIQVHEFESLLFVNPEISALSLALIGVKRNPADIQRELETIKSTAGSAEAVNDSPETAPSKRIRAIVPGYDKRAWGYQVAADVSLAELRQGCHWLDSWLTRLEHLEQ